jgi:hypothetical protein
LFGKKSAESEELGSDAQVYIPFVSMKKNVFEEGKISE